jgi:hypothetical protein
MGRITPPKTERNKKLVELKKTMTFQELARFFKISVKRAKEIYYRETKRSKQ